MFKITHDSNGMIVRLPYSEFKALDPQDSKIYKAAILEELRTYHQPLINNLGIRKVDFQHKTPFYSPKGRYVVAIFDNEFLKEKGLFFEMYTNKFDSLDEERTVYNVPHNPNYEEEYEAHSRPDAYLVPVDELRIVNRYSVAISGSGALLDIEKKSTKLEPKEASMQEANSPFLDDCLFSEMTVRDYYAMKTGKPISLKNWLNDLIKSTNK